ncbi:hypothetical protein [Nocardioides sp. P5_C9_2]
MTIPDHGVDLLLRQAADHLAIPDVDRLVAGGVTRGRTRRRRARIGTAVASVAVLGVVGVVSAVVPRLGADVDSARDPRPVQPATSGPTAGSPDVAPPADVLRPLVGDAAMAAALQAATGAQQVRQEIVADDGSGDLTRRFYLTLDGAEVSFRIRWYNSPVAVADGGRPLSPDFLCEPGPDVDCTTLVDGSRLLRQEAYASGGDGVPNAVQERTASLATWDGWQVDVIATNTPAEKSGEVVADEPVLTLEEVTALATSPEWYR